MQYGGLVRAVVSCFCHAGGDAAVICGSARQPGQDAVPATPSSCISQSSTSFRRSLLPVCRTPDIQSQRNHEPPGVLDRRRLE
jgi:hypothetical protein